MLFAFSCERIDSASIEGINLDILQWETDAEILIYPVFPGFFLSLCHTFGHKA